MEKYEELLVSLRRVIRAIDLFSRQLNKETGLTSPQLLVLQEINNHDGITVKMIAENINLSAATVTNILDRLASKNLVYRERSTLDKRKVELHLTTDGQTILSDAPMPLQEHFIQRFETLENWEQTQMLATMQRIAQMMDAQDIDASPVLEVGQLQQSPKL